LGKPVFSSQRRIFPLAIITWKSLMIGVCHRLSNLSSSSSHKLINSATVYEQTMRLMGIPEKVIAAHQDMLQNLLGLVKGRIYYNINNWYRGLLLLPSFKQNKADMERMMGLQDPVDFVETRSYKFIEKVSKLPGLLQTYARLLPYHFKYRFFCFCP